MRIIAGAARGRAILSPKGRNTRPTADRVKEALFSMIESRLALDGARVLDLYAGSGALGLEGLSRGAATAVFVDHDASAIRAIASNAKSLGFMDRCTIMAKRVERCIDRLSETDSPFDVIFADPPYADTSWSTLRLFVAAGVLADDGVLAVEHAVSLEAPPTCGDRPHDLTRKYGDTAITIYRRGSTSTGIFEEPNTATGR